MTPPMERPDVEQRLFDLAQEGYAIFIRSHSAHRDGVGSELVDGVVVHIQQPGSIVMAHARPTISESLDIIDAKRAAAKRKGSRR